VAFAAKGMGAMVPALEFVVTISRTPLYA